MYLTYLKANEKMYSGLFGHFLRVRLLEEILLGSPCLNTGSVVILTSTQQNTH